MGHKSHFRRCHICGALNAEHKSVVQRCQKCRKHLAPFIYFDETLYLGLKTKKVKSKKLTTSSLPYEEYPPLIGLTVYW